MPKSFKLENSNILVFGFLFISLFLSYLPAFSIQYAHHDGYLLLTETDYAFGHSLFMLGRFLLAFLVNFLDWFANSIQDLVLIRLLAFLVLFLTACIYFVWLNRYLSNALHAYLICLITFTLPAFSIFIAWEVASAMVPSIFSLLAAFILATPYSPTTKSDTKRRAILAFILLLSSLSVYPSAATFYCVVPAGILLFGRFEENTKKTLISLFLIGLCSLVFYALALAIAKHYFIAIITKNTTYNPYILTTDFFGKLKWFISEPLINCLNGWNIFSSKIHALFYLIVIVAGSIFSWIRHKNNFNRSHRLFGLVLLKIFLIFVLIILAYLPNLLAVINASWYRCATALSAIAVLIFLWAIIEIASFFPKNRNKLITTVLILLSVKGLVMNGDNVLYYRAVPSYLEFNFVKNILKEINPARYKRIHVILPTSYPIRYCYDEFGTPTFRYYPYSLSSMLAAAIQEDNKSETCEFILTASRNNEEFSADETTFIIDMRYFTDALKLFMNRECRYCRQNIKI